MQLARLACLVLVVGISCIWTQSAESKTKTKVGTDDCTQTEQGWTPVETNIWTQLCRTGTGDGWAVPRQYWDKATLNQLQPGVIFVNQPVRAFFVETILEKNPYRQHVESQFYLRGIYLLGRLDIVDARLKGDIRIADSEAPEGILLDSLNLDGSLQLTHVCAPFLYLENSEVRGSFNLEEDTDPRVALLKLKKCEPYRLHMQGTDVSGNVSLTGVDFINADLTQLRVGRELDVTAVSAVVLSLRRANISGSARLPNLKITGVSHFLGESADLEATMLSGKMGNAVLSLEELSTTATVDLSGASIFGDANLAGLHTPSTVNLSAGQFFGLLNLDRLRATSTVDLSRAKIYGAIGISDADIDGSLILKGANVSLTVDASNTHIGKSVELGPAATGYNPFLPQSSPPPDASMEAAPLAVEKPVWGEWSSLILVNGTVGAIDTPYDLDSWPPRMDLTNLTFGAFLGRTPAKTQVDLGAWFKEWLARSNKQTIYKQPYDKVFNPQPYAAVSHYLSSVGQVDAAEAVGIEEKDIERAQACDNHSWVRCFTLWTSRVVILYGYKPWISMFWAIGFIVVGALVFVFTKEARKLDMPFGLAYSFDMFIPLIRLRDCHYKIDLKGLARYYFYLHKIMGWLIGSFLVAALSGLTK